MTLDQEKQKYLQEFGNRVHQFRLEKGLSLDEVARKCGYTSENARSSIQKIEAGKSDLPASKIKALANALDVPLSSLMGFTHPNAIASDTVTLYNVHCETEQEAGLILTYRKLNSPNQKKCSTYAQKLLSTQELEDEVGLLAAHVRTDIQPSPEDIQHDLDIMNDDSKWN